jgi:hypothetical protein
MLYIFPSRRFLLYVLCCQSRVQDSISRFSTKYPLHTKP